MNENGSTARKKRSRRRARVRHNRDVAAARRVVLLHEPERLVCADIEVPRTVASDHRPIFATFAEAGGGGKQKEE